MIVLVLLCFGRLRGVATVIALVLVAATVLKLADYATFSAFNRTFNPVLDLFLAQAGFGLLRDSVGLGLATASVGVMVVAVCVLFFALRGALKFWARLAVRGPARAGALGAGILCGTWAVADVGHHLDYWKFDKSPPGSAWTSRLSFKRGVEVRATARDLLQFRELARNDTLAGNTNTLDLLDGRDVVLIWIESYGRASFDNPLYSETHGETLRAAETALDAQGMSMKSGWLASPTAGGESWLAHGALGSGLWTSDNGRYNAMIASGHKWLFHFAKQAGYRTVAVMPAITVGWPESSAMGFDLIFAARDIPYKGERFNWVTMPDQFTLATYESLLPDDARPNFIQVALISSHAPWTPIPDMVPWDDIGDGRVFDEMAQRGPTPRALWKDRDAVRDAYRRSVDYALQATFEHVVRLGARAPLVIVAGDHQAAGFVAGSENRDVPVHVIGPPEVVAHLDHWGWESGLFPASDGPVDRMDRFRNKFITSFSSATLLADLDQ